MLHTQFTNPLAKAMAMGKQMMGTMNGMSAMSGLSGLSGLSGMFGMGGMPGQQQPPIGGTGYTNPATQTSSMTSGSNATPAGTGAGRNTNTATGQLKPSFFPPTNRAPTPTNSPSTFDPMSMFNKMGAAMNLFNPPRQTSSSSTGTGSSMMPQLQKMQQMMAQFTKMGMSGGTGAKPANQQPSGRANGFSGMGPTRMGSMGMGGFSGMGGLSGMGTGGLPGMGMGGFSGMGMGGSPGMGSLANIMSVMALGEGMFDLPDPPAMGMGRGMGMSGMGMSSLGLSGMSMPSMGFPGMSMPGMGYSGMNVPPTGMQGISNALTQLGSTLGLGSGGGLLSSQQPARQSLQSSSGSTGGTGRFFSFLSFFLFFFFPPHHISPAVKILGRRN